MLFGSALALDAHQAIFLGMSFDPKHLLRLKAAERPAGMLSQPKAYGPSPSVSEIRELERVELCRDVVGDDGVVVPAGSVGTVVGIWAEGAAFEVEFTKPFGALATVTREAIAAPVAR